jgi:hypothetical protein
MCDYRLEVRFQQRKRRGITIVATYDACDLIDWRQRHY